MRENRLKIAAGPYFSISDPIGRREGFWDLVPYFLSKIGLLSHKKREEAAATLNRAALERVLREEREKREEEEEEKKADLLFEDRGRTLFVKKFIASRFEVGGLLLSFVWAMEIRLNDK